MICNNSHSLRYGWNECTNGDDSLVEMFYVYTLQENRNCQDVSFFHLLLFLFWWAEKAVIFICLFIVLLKCLPSPYFPFPYSFISDGFYLSLLLVCFVHFQFFIFLFYLRMQCFSNYFVCRYFCLSFSKVSPEYIGLLLVVALIKTSVKSEKMKTKVKRGRKWSGKRLNKFWISKKKKMMIFPWLGLCVFCV